MLKNKIIVKKIRNIFILLMAIIIMLGAYHNIRNSKAENVIQIELEVADKSSILATQVVNVDATETSDGNYLLNLPISVNKNVVTKYYTSSGEEILVDAENDIATIQLTNEEIQNKKVQVQTDYDTKEVTVNDKTELLYKKELTNEPVIENEDGTILQQEQDNTTEQNKSEEENQDVIVTGYMPEDAKLEVKEVDLATLTNVKVLNDKQTIQKAYEFSVYHIVEKQDTIDTATEDGANDSSESTSEQNKDIEQTSDNVQDVQLEKVEYDLSLYGEKITVTTNYEQTNGSSSIYILGDNNKLTEVEKTINEDKNTISFEIEKNSATIKYIVAAENIISQDETMSSDENVNNGEGSGEENTDDETANRDSSIAPNEIENSKWQVTESTPNIPEGTATIKVKGPEDILTEDWINIIINGEIADDTVTKKIDKKEKVSDGFEYTISLTGLKSETNQIKIELINPQSTGIQTLSMDDETSSETTSDDSGTMLLATTYNTLKLTNSETEEDSAFLGGYVKRNQIGKVILRDDNFGTLGRGLVRAVSGLNNKGTQHSSNTTTWADLSGNNNGTITGGATWGSNYLQFDGVDDWVNLGVQNVKHVTLDISFELSEIQSGCHVMIGNPDAGGASIELNDGVPRFCAWIGDEYKYVEATSALTVGKKIRLTATYDGKTMYLYMDGKLIGSNAQTGSIKTTTNNTVMAIGANPSGNSVNNKPGFTKMKVYYAKIHDQGLTAAEVAESAEVNSKVWDVSASQDKSIVGWVKHTSVTLSDSTKPVVVYIGSDSTIYANQDSSYLFSYIGYNENCTSTQTITNLDLLDTSNVQNMSHLFYYYGYNAMTSVNIGDYFKTPNVTNMESMFENCGYKAMTDFSLNRNSAGNFNTSKVTNMKNMFANCGVLSMNNVDLGPSFDTSSVTDMSSMFMYFGYKALSNFSLGERFDTSNVTDMNWMFGDCGSNSLTSLNLGKKFNTSKVTEMSMMFFECGNSKLTSLDLGPAFTKIADNNGSMFYLLGKTGTIIYAPESIYKSRTSFKKGSTDKTTEEGKIHVDSGRTVVPKYKPEWTVTGTTIDTTNKSIKINVKGAVNSDNYTSDVTTNLQDINISAWIDRIQLTGIEVSVSEAPTKTGESVTHTITITNFEEALRQVGKDFTEWSGNIALKIEGRNDMTSSYTRNVLVDSYGNQNMSKTDESGTWVDIRLKDAVASSKNTNGKLFVDFIKPEFTYDFSKTIIDHGTKIVTIEFTVADKYFASSELTSDTTASKIKVMFEGVEATNATKKLTKIEDVTYTIDGNENTKVGEKYRLEVTDLDQGKGMDYSGIMQLAFGSDLIIDKSGNKSNATTITVGLDIPQIDGLGHIGIPENDTVMAMGANPDRNGGVNRYFAKMKLYSAKISDEKGVISSYNATKNTGSGHSSSTTTWTDLTGNNNGTINGATWGSDYLQFDGVDDWVNLGKIYPTNQVTLEATISADEIQSDEADILCSFQMGGVGIYLFDGQPVFSIYSQENKQYVRAMASEPVKVGEKTTIKGVFDGKEMYLYVNGVLAAKTDIETSNTGEIVDVVSPEIEEVSSTADAKAKTASVVFNVTDKYLNTANTLNSNNIKIYADGKEITVTKKQLSRVAENDVSATVNGVSRVVTQQYNLEISGFSEKAKQVKAIIPEGAIKDENDNVNIETEIIIYNTLKSTESEQSETSGFLGNSSIQRQNVEKVIFTDNMSIPTGATSWDVSAQQDKTIMAWTSNKSKPYTVYIGSEHEMFASINSSYLFAMIGKADGCKSTEVITNLDLLKKNAVTDMSYMFYNTGYKVMTKLDLGSEFDTSSVTNMKGMFEACGYTAMTELSLGDNFDTTNVETMEEMFRDCGYTAMKNINFGEKFDTQNVTNMAYMFERFGYKAMTTLELGSLFNTGKVTNMEGMFYDCGNVSMTKLSLGGSFNTEKVTNMAYIFAECGYTAMTSLDLGSKFNTSAVTDMKYMFWNTGNKAMTSLNLRSQFDISQVTDMSSMFNGCGQNAMATLDLGPTFTNIADKNTDMFTNCGKSGAVINVPESIYKNRTSLKKNSTDTTTASGKIAVSTGRTVNPKYKPEWTVAGTTVDTKNKALKIDIKGATNTSNYTSNVTTALQASDISVWIDGTELTAVGKTITTPNTTTAASVTHTITITNFEESLRRTGKSYKEWSGNVTLKIGGRGEATSTYTKNVLTDIYGNQSMSAIDTSGTWVDVSFKDSTPSSANTAGKMFADFISPEFTYQYANTIIDHGNKKVTIVFSIVDKYFATSELTSDTTASKIAVTVDGKTITNDTNQKKKLSKEDIKETVDGKANTKIGEKYTLELTNLDLGGGGDYSGIVKLAFEESVATDKSGNKSIAKTITIGVDDPTTDGGNNKEEIVDVVSPVWKTQNINIDKTNKKVTVELIATDKYLTGTENSTLTTGNITVIVDGKSASITKGLSKPTFSNNSKTGLKEIKYTLTLTNWEQTEKQSGNIFLEWSGTTKIKIAAGTITDKYTNKSLEKTFELGHVDFIKPRIEKVSSTKDETAKTETIIFNVIDKYLDTTDEVTASDITVSVGGEKVSTIKKTLTRVAANDTSVTINGKSQVVAQQYKLVLSNFEQPRGSKLYRDWSGTVSIDIAENVAKDRVITVGEITSGGNTSDSATLIGDFVDFITPDFTYEYSNTTIDHGNKKVTIVFYIADKYFNTSKLTSDTAASNIKVTVDGKIITNDTNQKKKLSKEDVKETIDGKANTKIGEKYTLELTNLDLGGGGDYSGIVKLAFAEGVVTDTSENKSIAKTITIGIDDPKTGDGHDNGVIVDVVSPVWDIRNINVDNANKVVTAELIAKDKYLTDTTNSKLTTGDITVTVDGKTAGITKSLSKPTFSENSSTGLKEIRYILTLSNWEQTEKQSGNVFLEWSGTTKIKIAEETIIDDYTNKSLEKTVELGHVDFIKPKIERVSTSIDESAKTETIIFNVIDKYLDTSDAVTKGEITVYVDGENASTVTKTLTRVAANDVLATVNGSEQVVSQQYKLVLSDFEQSARNNKEYKDWSGTVSIGIAAGAVKDQVKTIGETTSGGNTNDNATINADFVDFVKPDLKYVHQSSDIDKDGKSYTMTFSITDKYYNSGKLGIDDLTIKMQNGQMDSNGNEIVYDLKNEPVTISLQDEEIRQSNVSITNTSGNIQTVPNLLIGHTYTLTISNLEQLEIKTGQTTLDYSGIVTVAVAGNKVFDKGSTGNNTNRNGNIAKTITSGVNIPGGTSPTDAEVVDVVDPVWKKVSSSASAIDPDDKTSSTATLVFRGTDSYYASSNLTANKIKIIVDGEEDTGVLKTLSTATELKEQRKNFGSTTTTTKQYGVEYTLTIKGFAQNANQVKIQIPAGTITDQSGNTNKLTEIIVYNVLLKVTSTPNVDDLSNYDFLGNTSIKRQNIENITFETSVPSGVYDIKTGKYIDTTAWDVSAMQDKSILAWYETSNANGALKVHIGSNDEIFANQDSSQLFSGVGAADICTATEIVTNLELLNVKSVISMSRMFYSLGYNAMTSLVLPSTFDTSNVTNMNSSFMRCGYKAMTTLELGTNFNTSNVTNMRGIFNNCGHDKLKKLDLSSGTTETNTTQFNTSKVQDMSYMFAVTGYWAMTNLNLGNNFDTSNVTNMQYMFYCTGLSEMTSLDLGNKFNTSNVTDMYRMFMRCGYSKMASLSLGNKFNTSKVTNMQKMFDRCGYTAMTSLDLGDLFYTTNVKDMYRMFYQCGATSMKTLDLGAAFTKIPSEKITKQSSDYKDWEDDKVTSYNAYEEFMEGCGTTGLVIYAPESIYSNNKSLYAK